MPDALRWHPREHEYQAMTAEQIRGKINFLPLFLFESLLSDMAQA